MNISTIPYASLKSTLYIPYVSLSSCLYAPLIPFHSFNTLRIRPINFDLAQSSFISHWSPFTCPSSLRSLQVLISSWVPFALHTCPCFPLAYHASPPCHCYPLILPNFRHFTMALIRPATSHSFTLFPKLPSTLWPLKACKGHSHNSA